MKIRDTNLNNLKLFNFKINIDEESVKMSYTEACGKQKVIEIMAKIRR